MSVHEKSRAKGIPLEYGHKLCHALRQLRESSIMQATAGGTMECPKSRSDKARSTYSHTAAHDAYGQMVTPGVVASFNDTFSTIAGWSLGTASQALPNYAATGQVGNVPHKWERHLEIELVKGGPKVAVWVDAHAPAPKRKY